MSPTVHKILIHESVSIKHVLVMMEILLEEAWDGKINISLNSEKVTTTTTNVFYY